MIINSIRDKQAQASELLDKLNRSLNLESMLDIDWSKGQATRYSQSQYIGRGQQVYKSWIQQGDYRTYLTATQYEKLTGNTLNREQLMEWSMKR